MDKELFEKALELVGYEANAQRVSLYSWTRDFFMKYAVPKEVVEFLEQYSFSRSIDFGNVRYYGNANDIIDNNLDSENAKCISEKLLIIGYGLNGDFIVLDIDTLQVGYVFHDDLWENNEINPRDIFVNLKCTIGQFYYNSVTIEDFPVDGYEAEEYLMKLDDSKEQ